MTQAPTTDAPATVTRDERFLFDLQGFLVLRGVLSAEECDTYLQAVRRLEQQDYEDRFLESVPEGMTGKPTKETFDHQVRLNGLPKLDPTFDALIDHPRIVPILREFMGEPALINTWSISKSNGASAGGWHSGIRPTEYTYDNGVIRTRMLNCVFFLTDNGPDDGCMAALPGSHKRNLDIPYQQFDARKVPGCAAVTGRAGDVLMFSEAVMHNGLPKTTDGVRTNLYYNYVHAHYNGMMREPHNCHHFYFPPQVRARFNDAQRELTRWMEYVKWDY